VQYLTVWFPGADFQHFAARIRGYVKYIRHRAFETVLEQRVWKGITGLAP